MTAPHPANTNAPAGADGPANSNAVPVAAEPGAAPAGGVRAIRERFVRVYLTVDVRSLAASRIALALVLLLDREALVQLGSWYTNDGLVPNHTLLWRPSFTNDFSFFFLASSAPAAVAGFVVCALAYGALAEAPYVTGHVLNVDGGFVTSRR